MSSRPAITPERERVARAEQPGGHALRRAGDRRDHHDADRPARDRLGHALPDAEPPLVLTGHQHARHRPLQVGDVGEEEEADEEDREGGDEDREEVAPDPEHADTASGTETETSSAPDCRFSPAPVSPSHESSSASRSCSIVGELLEEVPHGADQRHEQEEREHDDRERCAQHRHGRRKAARQAASSPSRAAPGTRIPARGRCRGTRAGTSRRSPRRPP